MTFVECRYTRTYTKLIATILRLWDCLHFLGSFLCIAYVSVMWCGKRLSFFMPIDVCCTNILTIRNTLMRIYNYICKHFLCTRGEWNGEKINLGPILSKCLWPWPVTVNLWTSSPRWQWQSLVWLFGKFISTNKFL